MTNDEAPIPENIDDIDNNIYSSPLENSLYIPPVISNESKSIVENIMSVNTVVRKMCLNDLIKLTPKNEKAQSIIDKHGSIYFYRDQRVVECLGHKEGVLLRSCHNHLFNMWVLAENSEDFDMDYEGMHSDDREISLIS